MKKVVVVIPLYKPVLDRLEGAGFEHNIKMLSGHEIVAVYPEGMDLSFYINLVADIEYKPLRLGWFKGIRGYNRMMISPAFYDIFKKYEYMLICHYDAWVFNDDLLEWCDGGFDYVAGPFLIPFPKGRTSKLFPFLSSICLNKLGNGGFCLRKIDTYRKASKRLRYFSLFYYYNEDVFWALFPPFVLKRYARPEVVEAVRFSGRVNYQGGFLDEKGRLPFGCHGWLRPKERHFWKHYIPLDLI